MAELNMSCDVQRIATYKFVVDGMQYSPKPKQIKEGGDAVWLMVDASEVKCAKTFMFYG